MLHENTVFTGCADASPRHCVRVQGPGTSTPFVLALRLDLTNHSPTGFGWGYGGAGPAQLALAILAAVSDDATALRLYQSFKWDVVAKLPMAADWKLSAQEVRSWLERANAGVTA